MYRKSNGLLSKEKNPNITLNKFCIISSGHKNLPGSKITITLQQWALFKSRNWIENVNQIINQITKITKKISLLYFLEHHHLPHFLVSSSFSFSSFSFLMSLALGWLLSPSFSFEVRLDAQVFPYLVCSFCPMWR